MGEGQDGGSLQSPPSEEGSPQHPQVRVSWKACSLFWDSKSPKPLPAAQPARESLQGKQEGWGRPHTRAEQGPGRKWPKGTGHPEAPPPPAAVRVTSEGEPATVPPLELW